MYRWAPTYKLLAARFSADLKQLPRTAAATIKLEGGQHEEEKITRIRLLTQQKWVGMTLVCAPWFLVKWEQIFNTLSGSRKNHLKIRFISLKDVGRNMQIHTHRRFDPLKVVRYHQGTCYPIYSQIEASFTSTVRKTKKWFQKKLYYRLDFWHKIWHLGNW